MPLNIPNLDRQQKQNPALGEALQKVQTYANLTISLKGSWVSVSVYAQGDIVIYSGLIYRSLVDANTGNAPATSTSQWQLIGQAQIPAPTFVKPGNVNG
jgi:hypothetical protein